MYMGKRLLYILAFADIPKIHVDVDMTTKQLIREVEQVKERLSNKNPCDRCTVDRQIGNPNRWECECDRCSKPYEWKNDCIKKLAEYETAEEEGGLVVLPCKVGDTVYAIRQSWNGWNIDKKKFSYAMIGKVGKTVFLTREKAEKALKEMKKNE